MGRIETHRPSNSAGCTAREFRVFDVETGEPFGQPIDDKNCQASAGAIDPNGQVIALSSCLGVHDAGDEASCTDGQIAFFDLTTGERRSTTLRERGWVERLIFSSDGRRLTSYVCSRRSRSDSCLESAFEIWDIDSGALIKTPSSLLGFTILASAGRILAVSENRSVALWDMRNDRPIAHLPDETTFATSLALSPDGSMLAVGISDMISLWRLPGQKLTGEPFFAGSPRQDVSSLVFSPNGRSLVARQADGRVSVWNITSGEHREFTPQTHLLARKLIGHPVYPQEANSVRTVAFNPDGSTLASGGDHRAILVWDVPAGRLRGRLTGNHDDVESIAFSPDGKMAASGSTNGIVKLWDMSTLTERATFSGWDSAERQRFTSLSGYRNYVRSVSFSPDARYLFAADTTGAVLVWDTKTNQLFANIKHDVSIERLAHIPGTSVLAWNIRDGIIFWDFTLRRQVDVIANPSSGMRTLVSSPDGKVLAVGARDGSIVLWDISKRQMLPRPFTGHTQPVESLAFAPDGRWLVSASGDGTVRLWDVEAGVAFGEPLSDGIGTILSVAVSPDGKWAASGHNAGQVRLWDLDIASWKTRACRMANRNMTGDEWRKYFRSELHRKTCPALPLTEAK